MKKKIIILPVMIAYFIMQPADGAKLDDKLNWYFDTFKVDTNGIVSVKMKSFGSRFVMDAPGVKSVVTEYGKSYEFPVTNGWVFSHKHGHLRMSGGNTCILSNPLKNTFEILLESKNDMHPELDCVFHLWPFVNDLSAVKSENVCTNITLEKSSYGVFYCEETATDIITATNFVNRFFAAYNNKDVEALGRLIANRAEKERVLRTCAGSHESVQARIEKIKPGEITTVLLTVETSLKTVKLELMLKEIGGGLKLVGSLTLETLPIPHSSGSVNICL